MFKKKSIPSYIFFCEKKKVSVNIEINHRQTTEQNNLLLFGNIKICAFLGNKLVCN